MSGLVVDLLLEGQPLRTVSFDRAVLRIGRMRENDLALDDLAVSRFHARLHLESGRVFLEDGGSENGSWVNGQRVRGRVELAPGDRIAIGKHELRVRSRHIGETALDDAPTIPPEALRAAEEPPLALPAEELEPMSEAAPEAGPDRDEFDFSPAELSVDVEEPAFAAAAELAAAELDAVEDGDEPPATVLLAEEDVDEALAAEPAPAVPAAPPPAAPTAKLHAGLIVQRDGKIERVVPWDEDAFTVGRSSDCDLVLEQDEVSRRHARFVRSGDRYEVHDLGSVNGTLVNGKRADRHALAVGDVIAVESFQLTFVLDREPITTAMKPAPPRPPQSAEAAGRDTFAMTILQEAMPEPVLGAPFTPTPSPDATIANVTLEEDLEVPDGLDLGFDDAAVEERKELAAAQPRGSSRAASVQDLGPAAAAAPSASIILELRLRVDQLPEPLRRALAEAGAADLVIPADVRLRTL
jgi:pSer/pThr/pTyr-binding forkhead associated (FHA) protein